MKLQCNFEFVSILMIITVCLFKDDLVSDCLIRDYDNTMKILFQGHHSFPNRPMNESGPKTQTQSPITTGAAVFAMKETQHFNLQKTLQNYCTDLYGYRTKIR